MKAADIRCTMRPPMVLWQRAGAPFGLQHTVT